MTRPVFSTAALNLSFLKYFYDVAQFRSVKEAALINHVVPSAITNGIKKLEDDLGVELLNHQRRKIELTQKGEELCALCEGLFQQVKGIQQLKQEHVLNKKTGQLSQDWISGVLKLGTTHSLGRAFFTQFCLEFKERFPQVDCQLKLLNPDELKNELQNQSLDYAFSIQREPDRQDARYYRLQSVYEGHFRFYSSKKLNEHQLEHTRFLVTHHWKEVQNFILNYKKRFKKTPEMGLIVPSWEILGSLLSKKNQYVGSAHSL